MRGDAGEVSRQTAPGLAVRLGFAPSRLSRLNGDGGFADRAGGRECGGGHPGSWKPGALGTGRASADGGLCPHDKSVATQVRPGGGSPGLRPQQGCCSSAWWKCPLRWLLATLLPLGMGRMAPHKPLLRARLAWLIKEQLEVTVPFLFKQGKSARAPVCEAGAR